MCGEDLVQANNIPEVATNISNYSFFPVSTFGNSLKDLLNMTYLQGCMDKYTPWTSVDKDGNISPKGLEARLALF